MSHAADKILFENLVSAKMSAHNFAMLGKID